MREAPVSGTDVDAQIVALEQQHARLANRIEEFDKQVWLSDRERLERKRLQKLKLATKDRLVSLRARLS